MRESQWELRGVSGELEQWYRDLGLWDDDSLGSALFAAIERCAHERFVVWSDVRPFDGTIGDVANDARRLASAMAAAGIAPGDVVAWQLPNWREAAIALWGALALGAVVAPIADGYGPDEVATIIAESCARLYIAPESFRGRAYLTEIRQRTTRSCALADIWDATGLDERLRAHEPSAVQTMRSTDPALVCYTSGSSAAPKGVIHTHRSMLAEIRQQCREPYAPARRRELVASPVGHMAGLLRMLLLPPFRGNPVLGVDRWKPSKVLELAREHDLVVGSGVIFFLQSLLDEPTFQPADVVHLRQVGTSGAPIPDDVARRADELGISLTRGYGSTEHPSIATTPYDDTRERRLFSDGRARSGVELRVTDEDGNALPIGEEGRLWSRGPDLFAGYVDPTQNLVLSADGWFDTGDRAVIDDDGFVHITGRVKDIIIRGGEKISAAHVERLLLELEAVAEAAVVPAPDERLGERVCAFVRLHPGSDVMDLDAVRGQLSSAGVGRHFLPEELHIVDEFVRSSTGKLDKGALRSRRR